MFSYFKGQLMHRKLWALDEFYSRARVGRESPLTANEVAARTCVTASTANPSLCAPTPLPQYFITRRRGVFTLTLSAPFYCHIFHCICMSEEFRKVNMGLMDPKSMLKTVYLSSGWLWKYLKNLIMMPCTVTLKLLTSLIQW